MRIFSMNASDENCENIDFNAHMSRIKLNSNAKQVFLLYVQEVLSIFM